MHAVGMRLGATTRLAFAIWLLALAGCSESSSDEPTHDAGADAAAADSGLLDASSEEGPTLPPSKFSEVPLFVERWQGVPQRLFVPVVRDSKDMCLLVDTGSQLTFVEAPSGSVDGTPAGELTFAGVTLPVISRPITLDEKCADSAGSEVVGIIGNDILMAEPWEFELHADKLRPAKSLEPFASWHHVALTNINDFHFSDIYIDDTKRFMAFDTGAFDTLLLGEQGRPGDQKLSTVDAWGNPVELFRGPSQVVWGTEPKREVFILRTPSFPSLEESNKSQGIDADGLIGLGTIGNRSFPLNGGSAEIRWEP